MATITIYNQSLLRPFNGNADDWDESSALKVALFTDTYTPSAADTLYSSLSGEVANGSGYTTGGATLANTSFAGTTTNVFDADDTAWTFSGSKTMRYAVLYDVSSSRLIGWVDFGSNQTTSSVFTIQWHASGIINVTKS